MVVRWRRAILSVAIEEMAHLACVNNLLVAVGGAPHFDRPNLPVPPGYHPAGIVVRLTPFDRATLDHFIYLERPEAVAAKDGTGFEEASLRRTQRSGTVTPDSFDYETIGELYDGLRDGFEVVAARIGESNLIDPSGRQQLGSKAGRMADISAVTTLHEARRTIERIKERVKARRGDERTATTLIPVGSGRTGIW